MEKLIREESPKLLQLVEQAAREEEDAANLMQLELVGQWLSTMQTRNADEIKLLAAELAAAKPELSVKERNEMERGLIQQTQRSAQSAEFASQSFRAMTSNDVGRRMLHFCCTVRAVVHPFC